jgi:hypothetical protein
MKAAPGRIGRQLVELIVTERNGTQETSKANRKLVNDENLSGWEGGLAPA